MKSNIKKIREMTEETMKKEMSTLQKEIRLQKTQIKSGNSIKSVAKLKQNRKQVARILTIKNEKNNEKGGKVKKK